MSRLTLFLLVAPLAGCITFPFGMCGGSIECAPAEPVAAGAWTVDPDGQDMPGMVDGVLDVTEDAVIVTWVDEHGRTLEAEYAIVGRYPERGAREPAPDRR